jgi:hypothetical protein
MASGEPLAGVKQTLKEKRTSETTALDFVPSWAGQLQDKIHPMSKGKAQREDSMRSSRFGFLLLSCYEKSSFPRTDRQQAGQRRSVDKVEEL